MLLILGDRNAQLVEAYQREIVLDVRLGLLFAMCNDDGSPEVVELLTSILKGTDTDVRRSAARSLSVIGFPQAEPSAGSSWLLYHAEENRGSI